MLTGVRRNGQVGFSCVQLVRVEPAEYALVVDSRTVIVVEGLRFGGPKV